MKEAKALKELQELLSNKTKAYLLVYKKGNAVNDCAFSTLKEVSENSQKYEIYYVDAPRFPEIHQHYGITSAPSLLVFERGVLKDVIKGCHDKQFFTQLFENAVYAQRVKDNPQQKSVTVYSTPSCPWCNTLKSFLRKNSIAFTDIDVSRDHEAARQMVAATGQQGVPQANIGGEWVVGFDQQKIKRLLNIQTQ